MKPFIVAASLLAVSVGLQGCDQGRKTPPKTHVVVVNAVPSYSGIDFLRVRRTEASLQYKAGSIFDFDADQYDFHVQHTPAGETTPQDLASFSKTLLADTDYAFVLTEQSGKVEPLIVETPAFDAASGDAQVLFVHADESLGAVDIYLQPPGTDLTTVMPLDGLDFLAHGEPSAQPAGDYVLTLTAPQDPATVLLESPKLTLDAGSANLFVVVPDAGQGLADINVVQQNEGSTILIDRHTRSALRVINGVGDAMPRDVYVDGDFSAPSYAAVPYAAPSTYETLTRGSHDLSVTPTGNVSAVELEESVSLAIGTLSTYLFAGDSNGLSSTLIHEDHRRLADAARLQILDAATAFDGLSFYVTGPDTDVSTVLPQTQLSAPGASQSALFAPGDYKLTVVDASTGTTVGGPMTITLEAGGLYGILAGNDAADPALADIVLLDDFN
jgi:hypothetical protein